VFCVNSTDVMFTILVPDVNSIMCCV